ncbi:MAG TPA: transglutaminase-like domain-containing protein [Chloroflexia bacterium]|nr:transglutaminase-like domain-containing protein [Chloroflexia bacterium]
MEADDRNDNRNDNSYIVDGSIFDYWYEAPPPAENTPMGRFAKLADGPDEEIDLAEAALMIAAQEYPGLNEVFYLDALDNLADEIRPLIATEADPLKNVENLNYFLNNLKGFHGNETDYSDRRNSYLNDVLERKTGIPITLSLLYIELGKRLGIHFEGIGLPGHFIIRYRELAPQALGLNDRNDSTYDNLERREESTAYNAGGSDEILLDPFNGGAILTEEDCLELVREHFGRMVPIRQVLNRPVNNRQFLTRMLNNLKASCIGEEDFERALEFQDYLLALNPQLAEEFRDRGLLSLRTGRYGRAISDLKSYLRKAPDASDAGFIRKQLGAAMDEVVKRN